MTILGVELLSTIVTVIIAVIGGVAFIWKNVNTRFGDVKLLITAHEAAVAAHNQTIAESLKSIYGELKQMNEKVIKVETWAGIHDKSDTEHFSELKAKIEDASHKLAVLTGKL